MMEQDVEDMAIAIDTTFVARPELAMDIDAHVNADVDIAPPPSDNPDLEGNAETDDDDDDDDDDSSSEVSIKSSLDQDFVLEEHYENGRRYANSSYFYPNDDVEETRLNIIHQVFLLALKGDLTISRVSRGFKRILDVGSGPGDWAIAMGERYPEAQVLATDISTYRPTNLPPNVTFQIDDASHEWTFTEPFDIIHMRDLHGAFQDWASIFTETHKHLAADGKLEVSNAGPFVLTQNYEKSYTSLFHALFVEAMSKNGIEWMVGAKRDILDAAGLKVVRTVKMEVALGFWSEDRRTHSLGKMALVATLESVEACCLRLFTRYLDWSIEQVRDLCENVKAELMNPANKATLTLEFIVAKKMPSMPAYD